MLKKETEEKRFSPYRENEPYVFISYAHADSDRVYPIINKLHNIDGLRIWYDDGIEAGDDWLDKIASRLNNAEYVICFMSPNASNSKYVRGEIRYAISNNKKILMTYLAKADLQGLSLIIDNDQSINWNGTLSDEVIYSKILEHANKSNLDIFDYSKIKKALLLNGHSVPEPYLSRTQEHLLLDNFITKNRTNKLLKLTAHSGSGKSIGTKIVGVRYMSKSLSL